MLPNTTTTRFLCTGIAAALFTIGISADAATLALVGDPVRVTATPATPVNLTLQGDLDWAYWGQTTTNLPSPLAPTNEKLIGAAIQGLTPVGTGSLRGTASGGPPPLTAVERYSYSDGTSPTAETNIAPGNLIFNANIGSSAVGRGLQLSIAGDPGVERFVTLYLGGFGATGSLTLTLNGAAVVTNTSQVFTNINPKQIAIYTLRFQPDSVNDLLLVQYTASAVSDNANGHVGLQAVTVSAVPEPGIAGLACLGALALTRRRRRR